jgi:hypothetical protein
MGPRVRNGPVAETLFLCDGSENSLTHLDEIAVWAVVVYT